MQKSPCHSSRNLGLDLDCIFYIFVVLGKEKPSLYLQQSDARHARGPRCQYREEVGGSKETSEDRTAVPIFHQGCSDGQS